MKLAIFVLLSAPLCAQSPLSLKEAVSLALDKHPSMEAAGAEVKAAEIRVREARSGYLPKLNGDQLHPRAGNGCPAARSRSRG